MSRAQREELEERLVSEWVANKHPQARVILRARVGPLTPEATALTLQGFKPTILMPTQHWIDALILYQNKAIIAEGKIKLGPNTLGQLLTYKSLFAQDPNYSQWNNEAPDLVAVYAIGNAVIEEILRAHGIILEPYRPQWVLDAYTERLRRSYKQVEF